MVPKRASSSRTGFYERQPTGYAAFVPNALPPDPEVRIDADLQALLSQADRALGRLDGSVQTLPNADHFVFMYVRREAVLSSQIEGTQSSLQDVLAAEAKILDPERPRDAAEVVNYVRAMNYGLERLEALPVSVRLIREIHEQLMSGVRGSHLTPGELRTSQNWIGPAGSTIATAAFVPPPPQVVGPALSDLEKFLHADSRLPLLIKIGLVHAQFETIHPFLDGNGRVGRLLITLLLCERDVLIKPVLYLSHYFKRHRQAYYDHLQAIRDDGHWEAWLNFFLRGVVDVSEQATQTARQILDLREHHRRIIAEKLGRTAGNATRVLESLYQRPIQSVGDIRTLTGTTYQAANALVGRLADAGILLELTGQTRNRKFIYRDYTALFDDPRPEGR